MSNSDFLLTTDADIVFSSSNDLEMLAKSIVKDSNLSMVGPLHVPTKSNTLFGNFSRYSALSFLDSVAKYNNGNNFYSCMSMEFMRKRFYKSFQFPEGTIADQCYAYWKSVENNPEGFKLVKNARVIFGVAQTFHDWRVLSTRSTIGDKQDTLKHFGNKILPLYTIPKNLLILSLIKWFFNNPLFLTGSVVMNIIIRMFPYNHKPTNGVWEMVNSSKELTI